MHPIERLRYVARSEGAPPEMLVRESAIALGAFGDDPAGMVAACRGIVERHVTCAPLWWLCARILCAPEPMAEAARAVDELAGDRTGRYLVEAVPDQASVVVVGWPEQSASMLRRRGDLTVTIVDVEGEAVEAARQLRDLDVDVIDVESRNLGSAVDAADLVLIEGLAVGAEAALVPAGSFAAAVLARHLSVPIWLIGGVGRLMDRRSFNALVSRWESKSDPAFAAEEVLSLDLVDRFACKTGVLDVNEALKGNDCPVAPELFRSGSAPGSGGQP